MLQQDTPINTASTRSKALGITNPHSSTVLSNHIKSKIIQTLYSNGQHGP